MTTGAKWWWRGLAVVLAIGLMGIAVVSADAALSWRTTHVDRRIDASGAGRFQIDAELISVTLVPTDASTVWVKAHFGSGRNTPTLTLHRTDSTVSLRARCSSAAFGVNFCNGQMTVAVPRGMELDVITDAGRIAGTVDVPAATLRSDIGDVDVTMRTPPRRATIQTDSGSVRLQVPEAEGGYRVDTTTDTGKVRSTVVNTASASRILKVTTDLGPINIVQG